MAMAKENKEQSPMRQAQGSETATPIQSILKSMSETWETVTDITSWKNIQEQEQKMERSLIDQEEERKQKNLQTQRENPEKVLRYWGVPQKHMSCSFDNFMGGDAAKEACIEASKKINSILLSGTTGCGKTHLAVAMMRRKVVETDIVYQTYSLGLWPEKSPKACFITVPELLLQIRATYNNKSDRTEEELIDEYGSVSLLVLDDLGSEKPTEWAESTLYLIIDRRNRDDRWTIVTTNLSLGEIEQRIGARIASRLADMKIIKLNLPDYRKKRHGK